MKRTIILFVLFMSMYNSSFAQTDDSGEDLEQIDVTSQDIDDPKSNDGIHRMPPLVPTIYLDRTNSRICFDNPCYSTTLSLVDLSTGASVYSYVIPDGADTVVLPEWLAGTYEIHIHCGNYCFYGQIVL